MEKSLSTEQLQFSFADHGLVRRGSVFNSTFFYDGKYFDQYGHEKKATPEEKLQLGLPPTKPTAENGPASRPEVSDDVVMTSNHVNWNQFTKNTTFHGIKYVFDQRSVTLRRLIWFVCVVGAITLFSIQVIDRSREYFRYRSNVNVEMIYVDAVEFPSVTICNQNTYRIAKTVEIGLYDFMDYIYGVNQEPDADLEKYNLEQYDLLETVQTTAHQKYDFIDSCIWKGSNCNITEDFDTTITDFGICYTFNSGKKEPLYVSQSGSGFALGLILNIEQYEYMKGPKDEAGIKVLLHDPSEVPLVKDLGFAIAPGTHTLVGVSRQEVNSLGSPYGACSNEAPPRSHCITQCRALQTVEKCGCTTVDMPHVEGAPTCNMTMAYTCVEDYRDSMNQEDNNCQCRVPCRRVAYEPELSYAHISKLTVDRISLHDDVKRQHVQANYELAREVAQRVTQTIADKDAELMAKVMNWSATYQEELEHSYMVIGDREYLQQEHKTTPILEDAYGMMGADFEMLKADFTAKSHTMNTDTPYLSKTGILVYDVERFLDIQDGISPLRSLLQQCVREESNFSTPFTPDYYSCTEEDLSFTFLYYRKIRADAMGLRAEAAAVEVDEMIEKYLEKVEYLFGNTTSSEDIDGVISFMENLFGNRTSTQVGTEHFDCLDILNETVAIWLPKIDHVRHLSDLYYNETSWTKKLEIVDELEVFLNETYTNDSVINMYRYDECNWFRPEGGAGVINDPSFSMFLAHKEAGEKAYLDAKGMTSPLLTQGQLLKEKCAVTSLEIFRPIEHFLDLNLTKMDLSRHFLSPEFKVAWGDLRLNNDRFVTDFNQFGSKVLDLTNNNRQAFGYSFHFATPVMNDTVINLLQHVEYAQQYQYLDEDLQHHLACLKVDREGCLLRVVDTLYNNYYDALQVEKNNVLLASQELEEAIADLQSELTEFVEGNIMSDAFFMENYIKVEIFYKELSYESIRQQVAFEFLSLISEIGGFMGLLLGASVLTMFELVDYLTLVTIRKCKRASALATNQDSSWEKSGSDLKEKVPVR